MGPRGPPLSSQDTEPHQQPREYELVRHHLRHLTGSNLCLYPHQWGELFYRTAALRPSRHRQGHRANATSQGADGLQGASTTEEETEGGTSERRGDRHHGGPGGNYFRSGRPVFKALTNLGQQLGTAIILLILLLLLTKIAETAAAEAGNVAATAAESGNRRHGHTSRSTQ